MAYRLPAKLWTAMFLTALFRQKADSLMAHFLHVNRRIAGLQTVYLPLAGRCTAGLGAAYLLPADRWAAGLGAAYLLLADHYTADLGAAYLLLADRWTVGS